MFYVVCVYILVCGMAIMFLPNEIPEERANRQTIFDKDEPKDLTEKCIQELLNEGVENDTINCLDFYSSNSVHSELPKH